MLQDGHVDRGHGREGVFDPNWIVHCTGYFDIGDMHMTLKEEAGHDVSYKEALTHSFNTYFATLRIEGRARHPARHRAQL